MKEKCKKLVKQDSLSFSNFCTVNSYVGWLKWCNSYDLSLKYINPLLIKEFEKNPNSKKVVENARN